MFFMFTFQSWKCMVKIAKKNWFNVSFKVSTNPSSPLNYELYWRSRFGEWICECQILWSALSSVRSYVNICIHCLTVCATFLPHHYSLAWIWRCLIAFSINIQLFVGIRAMGSALSLFFFINISYIASTQDLITYLLLDVSL